MVATAIVGSAVIGAGASYVGSSNAASAQKSAANQANATSREFFDKSQGELQPFIDTGQGASNKLADLQGFGTNGSAGIQQTLEGLPGYQFTKNQGLQATQNGATARGLGVSGASDMAAGNYATNLANSFYNNYLTGLQNTESIGSGAASSLSGAATSAGSAIGQNTIGAGNAQAASSIAGGNAIGSAAAGVPNALIASSLLQSTNAGNSSIYEVSGVGTGNNSSTGTGVGDTYGNSGFFGGNNVLNSAGNEVLNNENSFNYH